MPFYISMCECWVRPWTEFHFASNCNGFRDYQHSSFGSREAWQESGKICWFGSVPLWFKCTPLIFIYLFVCFSPENKTCSMCEICNVCCSHVGRVCCAHDAGYKDQCTKMHWWHRPVLMTLLPAPSPWFSLPVAKMLWFSATHLLEGCRGYLNHLQVLTCSPAPWRPACRRDKWGQQ